MISPSVSPVQTVAPTILNVSIVADVAAVDSMVPPYVITLPLPEYEPNESVELPPKKVIEPLFSIAAAETVAAAEAELFEVIEPLYTP